MNKDVAIWLVLAGLTISVTAGANDKWDVNGFVTLGGGLVLDNGEAYFGLDDSFNLEVDSKIGLQVDLELTEKFSATVQGVVRGSEGWEPEVAWAYLSYELTKNWKVRAGRLRGPFYMISDYLEVGYAYPWVRPPEEAYDRLPINEFDGVDVIYSTSIGQWDLQAQSYYAKTDTTIDFAGENADTKIDHVGLVLSGSNDWLTLRASYHHGDTDILVASLDPLFVALEQVGFGLVQAGTQLNIPPLVDAANEILGIPAEMSITGKSAAFVEAGFIVDPGENWFVRGEWTGLRYDRHIIPQSTSYYTTAGLRDNSRTYFLTFAEYSTEPQTGFSDPLFSASSIMAQIDPVTAATLDALAAAVDGASFAPEIVKTWTLGLRWDFRDRMAFKAEYAQTDNGLSNFGVASLAVDFVF